MDFNLTAEQVRIRDAARVFCQRELPTIAKNIERTNEPPTKDLLRRFAEMGFLGINISTVYGGLGLGNLEALLVIEEFAKIHPALAFPVFESCVGPVCVIEHYARKSLRQSVIPKVCSGSHVVAVAMSEPDAGTALTDLKTTAKIEGENFVLNGTKRWCSGGGHADGYLVYCRLGEAKGAAGIGAVYVDKEQKGLTFGAREHLMGFRGIHSADIYFDNVRIPKENVVVPAGGFGKLMEAFDLERCGNATMCLGIAAAAFDEALAYTQERKQFGKPLIDFQAVQLKLAEMAMQVEAARLLIYKAITVADAFPSVLSSSMAKCFANEMVRSVCSNAMQVMGAYGYSKEFSMEQRLRDGFGWGIAGGAIDIQKTNIASALVGRRFSQRS